MLTQTKYLFKQVDNMFIYIYIFIISNEKKILSTYKTITQELFEHLISYNILIKLGMGSKSTKLNIG